MKWCSLEECDGGWIKVHRNGGPVAEPCPACAEVREKAGNPGAFVISSKQADKYDLLARYRAALESLAQAGDDIAEMAESFVQAGDVGSLRNFGGNVASIARAALGEG